MRIVGGVLASMIEDALERAPEESCGFLAGYDGMVTTYIKARNASTDPRRDFAIDATQQIEADDVCRERKLTIYGIVHSHPAADAMLSPSDLLTAANPALEGWYWLVLSLDPSHGGPMTRCWTVSTEGYAFEDPFEILAN